MAPASKMIRAALYARFSSDLQKDTSIDRQFADLERAAKRLVLKLDKQHYYADRAQSATSLFDRPGLTRELLNAAKAKKFDIVLVEATDRLSRNRADLFWLVEQFKFYGVKIYTPSGEVTDLQLTFDGHKNAEFVSQLAGRVRSGHDEMARQGLIPGKAAYGYDCVDRSAGEKIINKEKAKIVVRIFTEYASGKSPRQIAADLMRDKVPSPTGTSFWNYQSIVGGSGNKRGMLHNQLYLGVYLKNRYINVPNPNTGKTITRKADEDTLITAQVPHLRIISQKLWDAAHRVRAERGSQKVGRSHVERAVVPRQQHLLAGLLRCGECSGKMITVASDRNGKKLVCCSDAHKGKTCSNGKSYNLHRLTELAIDSMHKHLTDPDFLKEKALAKTIEYARLEKEQSGERQAAQKQVDRLNVQIAKLVRMIDEEDDLPKELLASLKAKEIERKGLEERLRLLGAESNVTILNQPHVLKSFGKSVETLHAKLLKNPDDEECRMAFGNIIDSIIVHPTGFGAVYDVSLYARLSAITGVDLFPKGRSSQEMAAAEGFPRALTKAGLVHQSGLNKHGETLILLGRFKAAA